MKLVRIYVPGEGARLGQLLEGTVYDLTASGLSQFNDLASMLQASTQRAIEEETERLRIELRRQAVELSQMLTEKVLGRKVS